MQCMQISVNSCQPFGQEEIVDTIALVCLGNKIVLHRQFYCRLYIVMIILQKKWVLNS